MIQNFLILISLFLVGIYSDLRDQKIVISMDVEREVMAGDELLVKLTIDKGDVESFSRFTQTLPYGLTAMKTASLNADFSFEEQRLRIIWLKLPPQDKIVVEYKIKVDPRITGSFDLSGNFAFVQSNQRRSMDIQARYPVNILPNPDIASEDRINIDDFQTFAIAEQNEGSNTIRLSRSKPVKNGPFEYTVNIRVNKGNLNKFAKVEDYIPEGFRVIEGDSKDGIFRFNQGMVKILWMTLPEEQEFDISYIVVPDPGQDMKNFKVEGVFSYISGNETKSVDIDPEQVFLADEDSSPDETLNPTESEPLEEITEGIAEKSSDPPIAEKPIDLTPVPENITPDQKEEAKAQSQDKTPAEVNQQIAVEVMPDREVLKQQEAKQEKEVKNYREQENTQKAESGSNTNIPEKKPPVKKQNTTKSVAESTKKQNAPVTKQVSDDAFMLTPEKGVYYRVQLAAGHNRVNVEKYFKKRNMHDEVKMEFHEGWRKYTAGSFYVYKEARDYRVNVRSNTAIKDAFVSAYNEGERITVQEALMLSNQKWYR